MRPQHNYAPTFFDEDDMVYFGFLGLFSMIAITFMIYVMNTEPPPILDQEELQQRFVELLDVPPPEEEVLEAEIDPNAEEEEVDEDAPPDPNAEAEAPAEEVAAEEAPAEEAVEEKAEASSSMSETDKAAAEAEVEATAFIQLLGTRGEGKGAISSAFGGAGTNADLDSVLSNVTSGAVATAANQSATRGQTDKSGRASADIGVAKAGSKVSSGKVSKGPGSSGPPSGSVGVKQIETAMGECADAIKKVVRRKNAQIKYCYESRLKEDPNLRGRVVLEVTIDSGSVVDVAISKNKTGDKKLGACIKKKVRKWSFPATCSDIAMFPFALSPGS
jgi:cytoskeletal protein RodZ